MPNQSLTHFCISCGEPFQSCSEDAVLCPDCGGSPQVETTDRTHVMESPLAQGKRLGVSEWQKGEVVLETYEVREELGQGGFGKVYRVHHNSWDIDLAVKRPLKLEETSKQSFIAEAEKWIDLGLHPNIVSCYYVRTIDGFPHTFAELVEGGSLKDWIEDRRLYIGGEEKALKRILDIAIQFAWGLAYAHEKGLVHQDVKPGNVLMSSDEVAKVSDFGLAKARTLGGEATIEAKQAVAVLVSAAGGTPAFRSPEQARGERLSFQTDLWSWAVSILEMFAGELFWRFGEAADEVFEDFLAEGSQEAGLPRMHQEITELLRRCLRRSPVERPQGLLEVAEQLQTVYRQLTGQPYPRQMPRSVDLRADSLNNKALSLLDLQREADAQIVWERALEVDQDHIEANYNLGLWRWRNGSPSSDLQLVNRIESLARTKGQAWKPHYMLSMIHLERGDPGMAEASLRQAEERIPDSHEVQLVRSSFEQMPGGDAFRTFTEHSQTVWTIKISADGRRVISGEGSQYGGPSTLFVWDIESGRVLRKIVGHEGAIRNVCWMADGRHAITSSDDHDLRLWDLRDGECLQVYKGHTSSVWALSLTPDERFLVSGGGMFDHTVRIWDLTNGDCLRVLQGHTDTVCDLAVSPDGRFIVSGSSPFMSAQASESPTLRMWDLSSGQCLHTFNDYLGSIHAIAFIHGEDRLLTGGGDGILRMWDFSTGECLRASEGHEGPIMALSLDGDARKAITCGRDWTVRLWDASSGRCLRTFTWQKEPARHNTDVSLEAAAITPDGRIALAGGVARERAIRIWRLDRVGLYKAGWALSRPLSAVHLEKIDTLIEGQIREAQSYLRIGEHGAAGKVLLKARLQPEFESSPELLNLLQQAGNRAGRRTGLISARCTARFDLGNVEIEDLAFVPGCNQFIAQIEKREHNLDYKMEQREDRLGQYDLTNGKFVRASFRQVGDEEGVILSLDKRSAVTYGRDHTIRIWNLATGVCVRILKGSADSSPHVIAISPDGHTVASCPFSMSKPVELWDVERGAVITTREKDDSATPTALAFTLDGQGLVCGSAGGTLDFYNLSDGAHWSPKVGNQRGIRSIVCTLDGRYVLAGDDMGGVYRYDLAGRSRQGNVQLGTDHHINKVCCTADGRYALTAGYDWKIKIIDLIEGEALHTLEGHANAVQAMDISPDGTRLISGSYDGIVCAWELDWDYEFPDPADWEESAQAYLELFLTQHTSRAAGLSEGRQPTGQEVAAMFTRRGKPVWTEEDFQGLLYTLGCAGYGWLRPEGVRQKMDELISERGRDA
jgi:WD40 repeat protein/serine/threonine protein kinase